MDTAANAEKRRAESSAIATEEQGLQPSNAVSFRTRYRLSAHTGVHCNIARIQPFIDCNKRTARLVESIVMMNAGLIPVYSAKDADILNYRKGLISFYENETYSLYTDYFLDRQLVRIKELTTDAGMEM